MKSATEEQAAAAAAAGAGDFEALFAAQQARLVRLAGLLCGDPRQAEDAVAEVFARVYRRWPLAVDDVNAYLRRAVVNEVNGTFRRRRVVAPPATSQPAGDDAVAERDRVWRALLTLPARQRAALVLRYYEDETEATTGAILGIPVGTVKSTVSRGLDKLRLILGEEES